MRAVESAFRARFAIIAAWPLALLLAAISLGGILTNAYAKESPAWVEQAIGQDWFDLVIAAPWIAICGVAAHHSPRWRVLLAGAYAYVVYELFIYAFAVHFNALFLLYCATLGLAAFALLALVGELREDRLVIDRRGAHLGGGLLVALGVMFTLMWLVEDLPAVLTNTPPATLVATGLFTNPVHAIDLSFVLPAHVVTGVLLWRRTQVGQLYGPIVLAFGIVMAASIGGMMVVIALIGGAAQAAVIAAMFAVVLASAAVLGRTLSGRAADPAYPSDRRAW
ncbi:MAG TPA: hypothetical protein VIV40_08895 [Kofleriaceae bacterium]